MSEERGTRFAHEEEEAIVRHMNGDHPEDAVLICRALGGLADATSASVTGVDREGMDFAAVVGSETVPVRLPWGRTLGARAEVRGEVVRLYHEACAALGIEPRQAGGGPH